MLLIKIATWNLMPHLAMVRTCAGLEYTPKVSRATLWPLHAYLLFIKYQILHND